MTFVENKNGDTYWKCCLCPSKVLSQKKAGKIAFEKALAEAKTKDDKAKILGANWDAMHTDINAHLNAHPTFGGFRVPMSVLRKAYCDTAYLQVIILVPSHTDVRIY